MASITTLMRLMKRLAVAGVLVLGVPGPVVAGVDEGVAALKRGDYETAYREILPLAQKGHAEAFGVVLRHSMAMFRKAATQGDANAQHYLGIMYYKGHGVPQDWKEAVKWTRKAAEQGHAGAQNNLGFMYNLGHGVKGDRAEALKWYRKAAEQGFASAQIGLGVMFWQGRGVPHDDALAYMWISLANAQGDERAGKVREIVAEEMTPADISKAQKMAREWKPKK